MGFSSQRELETLDQCENILRHINALVASVQAGPRLTVKAESDFNAAIEQSRKIYSDIAANCRRNLA